jgi:hypothetical protein
MKVFIGWSENRSKAVGAALRTWLPRVFQNIDIWMSTDIPAGAMWLSALIEQLKGARFGIVCITPENRERSWIHFEAGMIAKAVEDTNFVCPYLFSLQGADLQNNPLSTFEYKTADKQGTKELVESINKVHESRLPDDVLGETFEMWWPRLEKELSEISARDHQPEIQPKQEDVLMEILETVRRVERSIHEGTAPTEQSPPVPRRMTRAMPNPLEEVAQVYPGLIERR